MSGSNILLDTNAVLYILSERNHRNLLLENRVSVSFVTELELLSFPTISETEERVIQSFLNKVNVIGFSEKLKTATIDLRKKHKLKLPDALICATAQTDNLTLITDDKKLLNLQDISAKPFSVS